MELLLKKHVVKNVKVDVSFPVFYELDFMPDYSDRKQYGVITETEHITFTTESYPNKTFEFEIDTFYPKDIDIMGLDSYILGGEYVRKLTADQFYGKLHEASKGVARIIGLADKIKALVKYKKK